ncbi:hypothetical protein [Sphingomonas sp. 3-13AW]|uniref:hypothetical protein n=1 Tax=Sphingomonas sp. 3-13AW TaxID=3050450 RepID=UPI003BB4A125
MIKNRPLTPGLLASIALRSNHAMFMPAGTEGRMIGIVPWQTRIPEGLQRARDIYIEAVNGRLQDVQLLEEVEGRGFHTSQNEGHYVSLLENFPGMRELAEALVESSRQI